jgi:hypothetical protein
MNLRYKKALLHFLWAYIVVTILAYGISYAAAAIYKLPSYQELGVGLFEDPAFVMTVPWHLLINLLVWVFFGYLYLKKRKAAGHLRQEAGYLGAFWLVIAMLVDVIFFVLIPSPFSLTARQFYIEYQPWISITYLIVFISPLISFVILNRKTVFSR